ncbi:MAG: enoyl-CoA hydratase/isomerase family protein [Thermodesulfobacteriota bacterium]
MSRFVETERKNQTLWVRLVNPPVNFLTADMLDELFHVFKEAEKDDAVRVVVLTGGIEDTFIMHFSIPELARIVPDNRKSGLEALARTRAGRAALQFLTTASSRLMDRLPAAEALSLSLARRARVKNATLFLWLVMQRLYLYIERFPKITVAAINGPVNGGGMEISACFDFRFMVGDQGFGLGQPEVLIGIVPGGGGTQRVPRLIGLPRSLEWMLLGNLITPEKAKAWGLLTDVFPKKGFTAKVQELCDLLSKRPPVAVDAIKKAARGALETDIAAGLSLELAGSLRCFATKDAEKALEAYIRIIRERVEVPAEKRISAEDLFDIMQNARFVDGFAGK